MLFRSVFTLLALSGGFTALAGFAQSAPASDEPAAEPTIVRPAGPVLGPLLGLVVVDDPAEVIEDGRPGVRGVDVTQAGPFADPALAAKLQSLLGRPLDPDLLPTIRRTVSEYYADNLAVLVRLILPTQEVRDGVVQILIVRARIGQVTLAGEKWFSEKSYRQALQVNTGDELALDRLDAGLNQINASSFRRASVALAPAETLGVTDIAIRVEDRLPITLSAGYNDTGTVSTGNDRVSAGILWGDAFGRGDSLSYNFGASPGSDILRSHAVNYGTALPWGHSLSLSASHSVMHSELPPPFDQTGRSSSLNLRYGVPLPAWHKVTNSVSVGIDYKRSDSNLLFSEMPVFGSLTEIMQASLDYNGSVADTWGATNFGAGFVLSPGGIGAHNTTADFRQQRADASARYAFFNLSLARRTRLPANFSLSNSVRAQISTDNLLGSEQLALGGAYTIRGYDEGEVYADEGLILRNELNFPPYAFSQGIWRGQVQGLLFWDYGYGMIRRPLIGERDRFSLSSVGPGVRVSLTQHLSASFDYGWQLIQTGLNAEGRTSRGHVSVNASW